VQAKRKPKTQNQPKNENDDFFEFDLEEALKLSLFDF
jgi:hypothetical protein